MVDVNKLGARTYKPLLIVLLAGAVFAVWIGRHKSGFQTSAETLDAWDIPRLAAYLNDKGLSLRMVATLKEGTLRDIRYSNKAFLTTTDKQWDDLTRLAKTPAWIGRWRGSLYCERNPAGDDLARKWGDCYLEVGPFVFFGDPELLSHVRDALAPLLPSENRLR